MILHQGVKHLLPRLVVFLFTTALLAGVTHASQTLDDHLYSNRNLKPSTTQLANLEKYDVLIDYYSQFLFFTDGGMASPHYLRSLIIAESNVDPNAISVDNAIGLTQITLETGQLAAHKILAYNYDFKYVDEDCLKNITIEDLHKPAVNILICSYLTAKYNSKYSRKLELVVSAWNAGQGAIKKHNGVPKYQETMKLISRVASYYRYFAEIKG